MSKWQIFDKSILHAKCNVLEPCDGHSFVFIAEFQNKTFETH